jgi:methionyl-tRNA formyltransferase
MRVIFMGTGEIGLPVLRWLMDSPHELLSVVTQPDRPVGRSQRIEAGPIKASVAALQIPVLQPERLRREPEAVEQMRALTPDLIVVIAYGQILPRSVLEIPRLACLNLHASLLPRHRGAAPIQAAILAGDRETGMTVMYMDEGLDTGDILLKSSIPIAPDETGGSLHNKLAELAPSALAEAIPRLEAGSAPRIPQDPGGATYAPKLEREHGQIDWSESADAIERKIRAFDPWPGAYAILRDQTNRVRKLKIFRASVIARDDSPAPGKIATSAGEGISVGAHGGALLLQEVQPEGKKRMSAAEFLRGNPWVATATVDTQL